MCGRTRPNEKFSGRGHARHLCRDCARRPREQTDRVQALIDIQSFLRQRRISPKNISRLKALCNSPDEDVRRQAATVLGVAQLNPHKRRRIRYLARHAPSLLDRLAQDGLLLVMPFVDSGVAAREEGTFDEIDGDDCY